MKPLLKAAASTAERQHSAVRNAGKIDERLARVNLFIASPGDTAEARTRVRDAVDRINILVAQPNGMIVQAIGWEDVPAGKAPRAQERINQYVKTAHVFVGILNKRFGTPTGFAESGTKEEYDLITQRWRNERPPPEVMMYFKHLVAREVKRPSSQLKKVLAFKKRISKTDLYHEFRSIKKLGEMIENALAAWIYKIKKTQTIPKSKSGPERLEFADLDLLTLMLERKELGTHTKISAIAKTAENKSIRRLTRQGLIRLVGDVYKPVNSTEGFLSIVKQLNDDRHFRKLLESEYYGMMIDSALSGLVESRFHCVLKNDDAGTLRVMAKLSPSVADFLLFGDTELYDNLAEHAKIIGQKEKALALTRDFITQRAILRFATDAESGRTLDKIGTESIAGQITDVRIAVAFENRKAFEARAIAPSMRVKAEGRIEKGQMVAGKPELILRQGIIMMLLEEPRFAVRSFDRVINSNASAQTRAACLNNKAIVLRKEGKISDALDSLRQATELHPEQATIKRNLELAQSTSTLENELKIIFA